MNPLIVASSIEIAVNQRLSNVINCINLQILGQNKLRKQANHQYNIISIIRCKPKKALIINEGFLLSAEYKQP